MWSCSDPDRSNVITIPCALPDGPLTPRTLEPQLVAYQRTFLCDFLAVTGHNLDRSLRLTAAIVISSLRRGHEHNVTLHVSLVYSRY